MRVSFVKSKKSYIDVGEMTRSCERLNPKYILISDISGFSSFKELKQWINNLKYQDTVYFSCHYVIDKFGNIYNLIPESEVAYHTKNININNESIGIVVMSKNGKFSNNQKKNLKKLLIKSKIPSYIYPQLLCSRKMSYYNDHPYELVL